MGKEKIKALIEWLIAIFLIVLLAINSPYFNYYKLSPIKALEQSERTFHFGPSEIVEEMDFGDYRIYLGTYKDWYSAHLVIRHAGFFWNVRGAGIGEIDYSKDISYLWEGSRLDDELMLMRYFGLSTNPEIVEVELDVFDSGGNGYPDTISENEIVTFSYQLESNNMFLFHWNAFEYDYLGVEIRGLDSDGNVIYEEDLTQ